jgi:hypothetical protein
LVLRFGHNLNEVRIEPTILNQRSAGMIEEVSAVEEADAFLGDLARAAERGGEVARPPSVVVEHWSDAVSLGFLGPELFGCRLEAALIGRNPRRVR